MRTPLSYESCIHFDFPSIHTPYVCVHVFGAIIDWCTVFIEHDTNVNTNEMNILVIYQNYQQQRAHFESIYWLFGIFRWKISHCRIHAKMCWKPKLNRCQRPWKIVKQCQPNSNITVNSQISYCQFVFGWMKPKFTHCSHFSFIINKQSTFPFRVCDLIDSVQKNMFILSYKNNKVSKIRIKANKKQILKWKCTWLYVHNFRRQSKNDFRLSLVLNDSKKVCNEIGRKKTIWIISSIKKII